MTSDPVSLISVLLVFMVIFLDFLQRRVNKLCEQDNPPIEQSDKYNERKRELFGTTFRYALPVTFFTAAFAYILTPTLISSLIDSRLRIWNFDMTNTLFILFVLTAYVVFFIALKLFLTIFKEYRRFLNE